MIPRLLHQTWKTVDVPSNLRPHRERALALHPDWEHRLWTDRDNLRFVDEEFPEFLEVFEGFPLPIMRADASRYLIMERIGGLYLDLDYELLLPFDLLQHEVVIPHNRQRSFGDPFDGLGNSILASVPGHPFWRRVIAELAADREYDSMLARRRSEPWVGKGTTLPEIATGPHLLSRVYFERSEGWAGVLTADREVLLPPTPKTEREYLRIVERGLSYGIHHCVGSWRDRGLLRRFLRWLGGDRAGRFEAARSSRLAPQSAPRTRDRGSGRRARRTTPARR